MRVAAAAGKRKPAEAGARGPYCSSSGLMIWITASNGSLSLGRFTLGSTMKELLVGLALAFATGITFLAYKHPKAYAQIHPLLLAIVAFGASV